jgi:DNA-binding NtrC family response regulator
VIRVDPIVTDVASTRANGTASKKVLIVDDQASIRLIAEETLSATGYDVTVAASADEALTLARTQTDRYDVLVTDIGLPGIPGDELADLLLAESPDLRVVYISGLKSSAEPRGSFERHAITFLEKPFPLQALAAAVEHVLAGRTKTP